MKNYLNKPYLEKLKNEYGAIVDPREAFGFISALRAMDIPSEQILYITT